MQLNPSEISELIKSKIEKFEVKTEARNEGTIIDLTDGITRIHGLDDATDLVVAVRRVGREDLDLFDEEFLLVGRQVIGFSKVFPHKLAGIIGNNVRVPLRPAIRPLICLD